MIGRDKNKAKAKWSKGLRSGVLVGLVLGTGAIFTAETQQDKGKPLVYAIRDARVFDGWEVVEKTTVLVRHGRIENMGTAIEIPAAAEVVDGTGKTLLPGLIDSHVHVNYPDALKQSLVFGVTTVIDMFMDAGAMRQVKAGQVAGRADDQAFLTSAGTMATTPGGHGTQYGLVIPTLTRPEEAQAWVDARIAEGSDFIKIMLDDGGSYGLKMPTLEMPTVAALIKAAHKRGKIAVIHAGTLKNCQDALQAGVDSLAHLYFNGEFDPQFGRLAVQKQAFVIPTLSVIEAMGNSGDADVSQDARMTPFLKPADLSALNRRFSYGGAKIPWELRQKVIRQLFAANVPILAGTDAPNPGTVFGASLHHELFLLVQAGLKPLQALRAATSVPADKFRITHRGRIKVGYAAELLLVNGNPIEDIKATRDIVAVWHNGVRVDREKYRQDVKMEKENIEKLKSVPPPNSESGWISDFEGDSVKANFGTGWMLSTDSVIGGKSQAEYKLGKEGAQGSSQSLLITGTVAEGSLYNWAGVNFSPGPAMMSPANLSSWKGIDFWAKGDGKQCAVLIFAQTLGFIPAIQPFKTGPEWKEYFITFKDFGVEGYDIMGIFIGAYGGKGDFSLQIDDVRLKRTGGAMADQQKERK